MKQLTMGSLFDGSGGFPLASQIVGIKPVWASEIEPFPIQVTKSRFPDMKHLGSVTDINGADIEPVDIITFGSPCFPAGTLVLTKKGYIPIEDIKVGMEVLTYQGRWKKVLETGYKKAETIILKGNHYGLECTKTHPIYNTTEDSVKDLLNEKYWVPAKDMESKLWAVPNSFGSLPVETPSTVKTKKMKPFPEINEDLMYFIGRWLGDGWVRNSQRSDHPKGQARSVIYLCDSFDKENELCDIVSKLSENYSVEKCATVVKVKFTSQMLCSWIVENFGKEAKNKQLPSWVLTLPISMRNALLNGILDSDATEYSPNYHRVITVSKRLAHGIRLLGESLGMLTTIFFHEPNPTKIIEGRTVHQNPQYIVSLISPTQYRPKKFNEKHSWYRVKSIEETHQEKIVYNLCVEEDNSYVADGIVVHNCQNMSTAGRREGLNGEQSSLFFEAIRIIREMREATNNEYPKYAVWENVAGCLTSTKGEDFREVLQAFLGHPIPRPKSWGRAGAIMDNSLSLSRGECLMLSIGESPSVERECSLSAILQEEVDPKYFLSPTCCTGILRRVRAKGRSLPPELEEMFMRQAQRQLP